MMFENEARSLPYGGTWRDAAIAYVAVLYANLVMLAAAIGVFFTAGWLPMFAVWGFGLWVVFSGAKTFARGVLAVLAEVKDDGE